MNTRKNEKKRPREHNEDGAYEEDEEEGVQLSTLLQKLNRVEKRQSNHRFS